MTKTKQQEMLEVLTNMSAVAAEILKNNSYESRTSEEDVKTLLSHLKAAHAAE